MTLTLTAAGIAQFARSRAHPTVAAADAPMPAPGPGLPGIRNPTREQHWVRRML